MSTKKKRHSLAEIKNKLEEGAALAAAGRTQNEIAGVLGVSVMTFHRWRKQMLDQPQSKTGSPSKPVSVVPVASSPEAERFARIAELQLENTRLRKLVTDLLLEKMSLEDNAKASRARTA